VTKAGQAFLCRLDTANLVRPNAPAAGTPILALPTTPRARLRDNSTKATPLSPPARIIGLQDQLTVAENISSGHLAITAGSAHLDPPLSDERHSGYRSKYLVRYVRDVS
jgi:hypothetical protein